MLRVLIIVLLAAIASGCATQASIRDQDGKAVMIAGHDPVAYFKSGGAIQGVPNMQVTHEGRTYYFASNEHQQAFALNPIDFEPQYAGYCANGVPYGFKNIANPREFEIREGRLFLFADVAEHQLWSLDPTFAVIKGDEMWRAMANRSEFWANLRARVFKPSWYRDPKTMAGEFEYRNPGVRFAAKPQNPMSRTELAATLPTNNTPRTALGSPVSNLKPAQ